MMITQDYTHAITQAKSRNATFVNFDNKAQTVQPITAEKDTFTLSDRAMALMHGKEYKYEAPTYVRPETARSMLAQSDSTASNSQRTNSGNRFSEIMQRVLDQRLGVDREKLDEIDAMMEDIAKNEKMSPEEKAKALEELAEIREKIIEESIEMQKVAKQTNQSERENKKPAL